MPYITLQTSPLGPVVDAIIGVSQARRDALQAASEPIPNAQRIRALIDTGASCTCIDPTILQGLGLSPTGSTLIGTPSTGEKDHTANTFDVSLLIPHPQLIPFYLTTIAVVESQLIRMGIHALIGRDVLKSCLFTYDGQTGIFTLAY